MSYEVRLVRSVEREMDRLPASDKTPLTSLEHQCYYLHNFFIKYEPGPQCHCESRLTKGLTEEKACVILVKVDDFSRE